MERLNELQKIGLKYGTDKSRHSHKGFTYLERYEKYLLPKRNLSNNILEIGVLNGASLLTWRDYFPASRIIGLDIDPKAKTYEKVNIEIFVGSQDDERLRDVIKQKYHYLDIVLDDASHVNELTIKSFELYYPLLRDEGIYIIEDLCNTYEPARADWPGMKYNRQGLNLNNKREDFERFLLKLINKIEMDQDDIFSIHIYHNTMLIIKKV